MAKFTDETLDIFQLHRSLKKELNPDSCICALLPRIANDQPRTDCSDSKSYGMNITANFAGRLFL